MAETTLEALTFAPTEAERADKIFPTLTPHQLERVATDGSARAVARGEVLLEAGAPNPHCYVVTRGSLGIFLPSSSGESLMRVHRAGQFSGEVNLLSGRRALVRIRAEEDGEVIELE